MQEREPAEDADAVAAAGARRDNGRLDCREMERRETSQAPQRLCDLETAHLAHHAPMTALWPRKHIPPSCLQRSAVPCPQSSHGRPPVPLPGRDSPRTPGRRPDATSCVIERCVNLSKSSVSCWCCDAELDDAPLETLNDGGAHRNQQGRRSS